MLNPYYIKQIAENKIKHIHTKTYEYKFNLIIKNLHSK